MHIPNFSNFELNDNYIHTGKYKTRKKVSGLDLKTHEWKNSWVLLSDLSFQVLSTFYQADYSSRYTEIKQRDAKLDSCSLKYFKVKIFRKSLWLTLHYIILVSLDNGNFDISNIFWSIGVEISSSPLYFNF